MITFKHTELAKKYGVNEATVRSWINRAKAKKLSLVLHNENGIDRIVNTPGNLALIERLAAGRRKFRNAKALKVVSPKPEFYKLYNQGQMYDILNNIESYHEIPLQYTYFNGGADYWDRYVRRLLAEEGSSHPKATIELLAMNQSYLDRLLAKYKRVNVVDVGVGNAMPVRGLLEHLLEQGKLGRYTAVDISVEMIALTRRNIEAWFDGRVNFQSHVADIAYQRFGHLLASDALSEHADETVTLVLFLGSTSVNLRDPDGAFRTIRDSIRPHDLLVYDEKLDTEVSRRYFDFNDNPHDVTRLSANQRLILDLLNIDPSFYDVEAGYDEQERQRYIQIHLRVSLAIRFDFGAGERLVEFDKGTTILLWRARANTAHNVLEILDRNRFYILHASQTEDQQYILTVAHVKAK